MKNNKTHQFCLDFLSFFKKGIRKPLGNLLLAVSSYRCSKVIEYSESPLYQYQYSSLYKPIKKIADNEESLRELMKDLREHFLTHYYDFNSSEFVFLQTDKTSVPKPFSDTFENRSMISIPNNKIKSNRGLDIGYEVSSINLVSHEREWSLPLSMHYIPLDQTAAGIAIKQLDCLMGKTNKLAQLGPLVVNTLDSGYSTAEYLSGAYNIASLVSIVRFRHGIKVNVPATQAEQTPKKSKKIYGQCYYLIEESRNKKFKKHPTTKQPYFKWQDSISDRPPDEQESYSRILSNGRVVDVYLIRWNNLLQRTKQGFDMSDKLFDLIKIVIKDATTGKRIFPKAMYIGVFGSQKQAVSLKQAASAYLKRYGIEPFFRFTKQNMHLTNYQSPDSQSFKNWSLMIMAAIWLLYISRKKLKNRPKKWQKYKEVEKQANEIGLTMTQAYKAIEPYLLTLDWTFLTPQKSKGGKGRKKGEMQTKRRTYRYRKKTAVQKRKQVQKSKTSV